MTARLATIALSLVLAGRARAANLLVYNTNDSSAGSLRQAVADSATLGATNAGNGGIVSTTVSNAFSVSNQFYRVRLVP